MLPTVHNLWFCRPPSQLRQARVMTTPQTPRGARPFDRIGVFALAWAFAFLLIAAGLAAALG